MINKDKIMDELEKMKSWPMTPDNVTTMAAMYIVMEHIDEDDDDDDYGYGKPKKPKMKGKGENREGVSIDPYATQRGHARVGGKGGDEDMEKMFRKFMEQYSDR